MSWSSSGAGNHSFDLQGPQLTDIYNSPVYKAEWMVRSLGSGVPPVGCVSHSGVRVTLADGSQWLIHKGSNYGRSSQTVVVSARHMAAGWRVCKVTNFQGQRTVANLVAAGGADYSLFNDNCHDGAGRMMEK